jgi:predicted RNA-binding protein with RPS1 domain
MSILPAVDGMPELTTALEPGAELTGLVQKIERFGVFVWLAPGKVGLMPTAFTGIPQGSRMDSHFKAGQEVPVEILDIADGGRRIRLAAQGDGVARARAEAEKSEGERRPRADRSEGRDRSPDRGDQPREEDQGTFGTSMADLLKAAFDKKKS